MNTFTTKNFSDYIYEKLENIGYEIVLSTPTTKSKFPCIVLDTPIEIPNLIDEAKIIIKRFQISIQVWTDGKRECMNMFKKISDVLENSNILKTSNDNIVFDEITKKYQGSATYEVNYNALYHTFEYIRR